MLFPVLFDHSSDISNYLNSAVTYILFFVIKQLVQQWEGRATDALISHLAEILRNQRHKWCELVQESFLDVGKLIICQLVNCGNQDIDLPLVLLVGKSDQVVREVLTLNLGVALDQLKNASAANDFCTAVTIFRIIIIIDIKLLLNLGVRLFLLLLSEGSLFKLLVDSVCIFGLSREHIVVDKAIVKLPMFLVRNHVVGCLVVGFFGALRIEHECKHLRHVVLVHVIGLQGRRVGHVRVA